MLIDTSAYKRTQKRESRNESSDMLYIFNCTFALMAISHFCVIVIRPWWINS